MFFLTGGVRHTGNALADDVQSSHQEHQGAAEGVHPQGKEEGAQSQVVLLTKPAP